MAPPENSPSGSPSISPYRPLPLSEDTPGGSNRVFTSAIIPSPLLRSVAQASPIIGDESLRVRPRGLHGQSQLRPYRVVGDQPGPTGGDGRTRGTAGLARLRQSLRDNESRQQSQQNQAYGPRIPFWRPGQRQSLYDWAPATPPEDLVSHSLPSLMDGGELGDEVPRDAQFSQRADSPPIPGSPPQVRIHRDPGANVRMYESLFGTPIDSSFRSTLVQPLRQNPRRPIRSRPQWHSWSWEREREREGRDDTSRSRPEWRDPEVMLRSRPFRIRSENYRDPSSSSSCYELEEAIGYLAKLRFSSSPEDSLRLAVKAGFNHGDDWLEMLDEESRCEDLLLDTHFIHVAETSWLKVGGMFWGAQTTPQTFPVAPLRSAVSSASSTSSLPSSTTAAAISHPDDFRRALGRASSYYNSNPHQWTVKVIISSIDYSQLRLTGTMEAFTDFQTPASDKTSITTYLEGEIIDFKTHSLQTFNFPSNIKDDASNWRRLEPFCHLSNEQLVKSLVSRKFMKDLTDNWVFMRWKEKCFITPQTSPDVGILTIGGFYFLSLRRSDGQIQGFYYDPMSDPYQELNLKPQNRLFPTYEFR